MQLECTTSFASLYQDVAVDIDNYNVLVFLDVESFSALCGLEQL